MNSNDFISVSHILSEVTSIVNDNEYKNGFSKGWYVSRIQDALQELSFDTFFDTRTLDFDFPRETLAFQLPSNLFNVKELYLFNGTCCSTPSSQRVYWKRQYNNKGNGNGYTAKVKDGGGQADIDPYIPSSHNFVNHDFGWYGVKYYANIDNGMIMFSSDCRAFTRFRIIANGMGGDIGDMPIIPRFFERAINDYVKLMYYEGMKARDPRKYRVLWSDTYQQCYDRENGSWPKARKRISSMDSWEKEALEEYISAMYHK